MFIKNHTKLGLLTPVKYEWKAKFKLTFQAKGLRSTYGVDKLRRLLFITCRIKMLCKSKHCNILLLGQG
jgi:hypothetical protein